MPEETSKEHKTQLEKLRNAGEKDFDRTYMDMMVKDHQKDVEKYKKAGTTLDDPDLKAWVAKTLPVLENHLELAQQLNTTK